MAHPSVQVHDAAGIEKMRAAGKLAAAVLEMAGSLVKPGVTTDAIDRAVHQMIIEAGAYPSPLNYGGVCFSCTQRRRPGCWLQPWQQGLARGAERLQQ